VPPGRSLLGVGGRSAISPMEGININDRRSRLGARRRRLAVWIFLSVAIVCAAFVVIGTLASRAHYAAQLYP